MLPLHATLNWAQEAPQPSGWLFFLPLFAVFIIFYLLVFLPVRRRQRKLEQMIANLKTGDRVITTGGLYGTVAAIKEHTVLLKVADQVKVEVAKSAIAGLQSEEKKE